MGNHIATPETFMTDAYVFEAECPICGQEAEIRIGWVQSHCSACDRYFSPETPHRTVRGRRKVLGLTVEEAAERFGVAPSTVHQYERRWPSRRYYEATAEWVCS